MIAIVQMNESIDRETKHIVVLYFFVIWAMNTGLSQDDDHRHPNSNDRDHLVGQLAGGYLAKETLLWELISLPGSPSVWGSFHHIIVDQIIP